jgi:hypothetical protein
VFALFAGVLLVSLIVSARAKPFWHDEIFTILHAELPSLSAMWAAGIDGIDLSPPLNTWLTRAVHEFGGVGRVSSRVPPMAGFLLMSAVVFHLLKTRANTATALSGTLLPCFTAAYRYSYEARGYGLMVGLFALSLYAWSEAANSRRRAVHVPLLTIALAASVWNHYYGILTFLPIAGGEVVRAIQRRRLDAGIAAAFLASLVAMLPLYPLAAAAREQSRSFWSPASLSDVGSTYHFLFAPLIQQPAVAIITLIAIALFFRRPKAARTARTVAAHELVAGALSLLIPVLGVGMGVAVTGVFVPRYAMSAVVGVSLVIPLAVWQRQTRWGIGELFLCGLLAITFAMAIRPFLASPPVFQDPFLRRPLLQSAVTSGPPVVSSSSLQFLQYWYYSPSNLKGRLRYLADPEEARKRMRSDTIDRGYLALRRWTAVPVDPYVEYVAGHREFRVHEAGSGWLLGKLDEAGAAREEIGRSPGERLFAVRLP